MMHSLRRAATDWQSDKIYHPTTSYLWRLSAKRLQFLMWCLTRFVYIILHRPRGCRVVPTELTPKRVENSQRTTTDNQKSSAWSAVVVKLSQRESSQKRNNKRGSEGIVTWESYRERWETVFMVKDKCAALNLCRWLSCFYFVLSGSVWSRFSRDSHLAYVIVPDKNQRDRYRKANRLHTSRRLQKYFEKQ